MVINQEHGQEYSAKPFQHPALAPAPRTKPGRAIREPHAVRVWGLLEVLLMTRVPVIFVRPITMVRLPVPVQHVLPRDHIQKKVQQP